MGDKIKIGIIGFGGFGKFIFKALSHSEHFLVVAICDQFNTVNKIPAEIEFFRDWHELIKIKKIDAIVVSTPPSSHAEITIASLKEGKHVITEKPISVTVKDGNQIKIAANKFNRVVMVDFLQRFNPILETLQKFHTQNMFGDLERFYVENYAQDETLPSAHWFWDQTISGGILTEHAVHFIDIVHWFQPDEVERISGFCDQRNQTQTDRMAAIVQYKSGLMASHYHSFTRPNVFERTNMRFVFKVAQFDLNGWIPESGNFSLLCNEETIADLQKLPNLQLTKKKVVNNAKVRGGEFDFTHLVEGSFRSSRSKKELYALALQKVFHDFYLKLINKKHETRISLDDAIKAVYVAEEATANASTTSK